MGVDLIEARRRVVERRRSAWLWGREYRIKPRLIRRAFGDGMKPFYIEPIDFRPNFFVFWGDSRWSDSNWDDHAADGTVPPSEWLEVVSGAIEEEFVEYDARGYVANRGFPAGVDMANGCAWGALTLLDLARTRKPKRRKRAAPGKDVEDAE